MPNPVENLEYIKSYSSSSPRPIKCQSCSFSISAVDWEDLKPYWKSEIGHISQSDQQAYYLKVFQTFYNYRKKTNRGVVFCRGPLPNIFKYRDHRWDLPTIWVEDSFWHILKSSASMYGRTKKWSKVIH